MTFLIFYILSVIITYHIFIITNIVDERDLMVKDNGNYFLMLGFSIIPLCNIIISLFALIHLLHKTDWIIRSFKKIDSIFRCYQDFVEKTLFGERK